MPRLFLKLFGTFWLTTVLILATSIFVSFRLADDRVMQRLIDPREADDLVQEVFNQGGLGLVRKWLANGDAFPPGQTVYVLDRDGRELLGRDVPSYLERRLERIWAMVERHAQSDRHSERRRRHFVPVLESADGSRWLAIPGPTPPPRFGMLSFGSLRWLVLALAAITSFATFWMLSRSLSRPARRIADAVKRFAAGDLAARVGNSGYSNDEIGDIGRQFDRMAAQLETQTELRRELFRNVSHELRAPLARLQIAAELLERKPAESTAQLARIRSEIEVLDALTTQVMSLTRAAQSEGVDSVVSLADVVERVSANARVEAGTRGIQLEISPPVDSVRVRAQEALLASALENVVRNALQATPDGGQVSVAATVRDRYCSVTVTDSGPGVPEDQLERIFEPFFRLDTNRPGSGIGLAITARVMQQVGGSARAQNGAGGGLVVTLEIPVEAGDGANRH